MFSTGVKIVMDEMKMSRLIICKTMKVNNFLSEHVTIVTPTCNRIFGSEL
jgi:hypothetical protein